MHSSGQHLQQDGADPTVGIVNTIKQLDKMTNRCWIGAGISEIGIVYTYYSLIFLNVLRRDKIGGTWDLFKYPGIRSDSDMYTLGV